MKLFSKALENKMETRSFFRWLCALLLLSGLLTPVALGQKKSMSGMGMGSSGPGNSTDRPESPIADAAKATAFRERCLFLTTKFKYKGVDFQSKSGIGCIISTPKGQSILALPADLVSPVVVTQGNERHSIECSMLVATKLGNEVKFPENIASFAESTEKLLMDSQQKQPLGEAMMQSEQRISKALDEKGELSFNSVPFSGVMKFFKETYSVPIVIDVRALDAKKISLDEPITLETPAVTFRSALNLILTPLDLTYVIDNEVLKITNNEGAENAGSDSINHWNPVGPELESERKIFRSLSELGELSFNAMPLNGVMKFFREEYGIPIVIDEKALEEESVTPDEPITIEVPALSLRSALNLILEPLKLTYVIENEVLLITTKASAFSEHPAPSFGITPRGATALQHGSGFQFTTTRRFGTLQEAQKAVPPLQAIAATVTAYSGSRADYAAIQKPMVTAVEKELGVVFVSMPGDFQSVPIPARVEAVGKRFVMHGEGWTELYAEINKGRESLASVLNGSPVIDQRGEPVGLFIDQEIVSLPDLVQSLFAVNSKKLGYWGADATQEEPKEAPLTSASLPEVDNRLPTLDTPEVRKRIERVTSLKGEEKVLAQREIHAELVDRYQTRRKYVEEKLKSTQSKLDELKLLSDKMKNQDEEAIAKLLNALDGRPPQASP